jgi:hypothetical protein
LANKEIQESRKWLEQASDPSGDLIRKELKITEDQIYRFKVDCKTMYVKLRLFYSQLDEFKPSSDLNATQKMLNSIT